jgi:hypothetical protein
VSSFKLKIDFEIKKIGSLIGGVYLLFLQTPIICLYWSAALGVTFLASPLVLKIGERV